MWILDTANRLSQPSTNAHKATFERWALIGVLAVWAAMVGTMLSWIALYGSNVPWKEDWVMVSALVGKEPHLLGWLWAQTMEHRTPIQRAVYLLLLRASDGDFRIGMIADVLALGGISLVMISMARYLRGGETRLADVFFPLALLHLGHAEQIFLGYNIQFAISTSLICVWLMIIVGKRWPLSPNVAVTAGLTLVLLPLSGGNGMIFTPFVALWLAVGTFLYRRDIDARWLVLFESSCIFVAIGFGRSLFRWLPERDTVQSRRFANDRNGCEVHRNILGANWLRHWQNFPCIGDRRSFLRGRLSAMGIRYNPPEPWAPQHLYSGTIPGLRAHNICCGDGSPNSGDRQGPHRLAAGPLCSAKRTWVVRGLFCLDSLWARHHAHPSCDLVRDCGSSRSPIQRAKRPWVS
jgi:hypothetical protein